MASRLTKQGSIATLSLVSIVVSLCLRYIFSASEFIFNVPLIVCLVLGGCPLIYDLLVKVSKKQFGSDLLAGISIVTSIFLGEYLAGTLVVLMLSGGETLETYAVRRASFVLDALAKRMPSIAHRRKDKTVIDVALSDIQLQDTLIIYPHEICPVDGVVIEGHGIMDESYLTGEPFEMSKTPGSTVLSGAINGDAALTIQATKLAVDSRYAKIMEIMHRAEQNRPRIRRLGDALGAYYTPLAVGIAVLAWVLTGSSIRFLAVLVVATPCPLIIAIPVAIIGSISLGAKRGIIIKDPSALETIDTCRTIILDKTGTLTYGEPELADEIIAAGFEKDAVLHFAASLEQYSKHPLARAVLRHAEERGVLLDEASQMSEAPGQGILGQLSGKTIQITSRKQLALMNSISPAELPPPAPGLECVVMIDAHYAATYRFHDTPRSESKLFVSHLGEKHSFNKIMLVSGDRETEVRYLADLVGISEVHASKSPEEKVEIVKQEMKQARTLFVGDGINDAPALMTATVGIAFGQNSDITSEAAGAVILDTSLRRVDEFFHISKRMRAVALQSAVGGMTLSVVGMIFAACGFLTPVAGAVVQEIIDIVAIVNALRVAVPPKELTDF